MADIMIPQMLLIGLIIGIVVLVIALCIAIYKVVMYMMDMKQNAPEAFVIKEAREKKLPLMALHDAGSGKCILKLGKKSKKYDWEFEAGEYGPKVTPEHTPDCEPDMWGGNLPVYHYDMKCISACSPRSASAICNLTKLRALEEFALLRFLSEDDLYTLMKEDAANLDHDCRIYLRDYAVSNIGQPIPESVDDFVALIQEAREVFASEEFEDEEDGYYYTSLETYKQKDIQRAVKQAVKKTKFSLKSLFVKKKEEPEPVLDLFEEDETSGMSYELAYRTPCKLEPFSFKYAFRSIGAANEAITVRNLLDLAWQRGHEAGQKNDSKLISVGICALLILIGGAFACVIAWRMIGGA